MAELSPAAQAVYDAYCRRADDPYYYDRSGVVAVLRAAALHCKRDTLILLSIADELEQFDGE
jgi:hypothetical protein